MQLCTGMQFEVLCVTKRYEHKENDRRKVHYHLPITGTAVIGIEWSPLKNSEDNPKIVVNFGGKNHPLKWIRQGLDGDAIVLVVKRDDPPFEVWEFYTTTPFPGRENVTVKALRELAAKEIEVAAVI